MYIWCCQEADALSPTPFTRLDASGTAQMCVVLSFHCCAALQCWLQCHARCYWVPSHNGDVIHTLVNTQYLHADMNACMSNYRTCFAYIWTCIWICIACLCQAWMWMDACCAQGIQMLLFRVRGFVPTALPLKQFFAIPWMYAQHVCEIRFGTVLQIDMAKSTGYFRKPDIFRILWGYQGCAWAKAKYFRKKMGMYLQGKG